MTSTLFSTFVFLLLSSLISTSLCSPLTRTLPKPKEQFSVLRHPLVRYNAQAPACPVLLPQHPPVYITPRPSASPWVYEDLDHSDPSWQSSSPSSSGSRPRLGANPRARIIGGRDINAGLSRYVALLLSGTGKDAPFCTASIVSKRLLITAAHCVLYDSGAKRNNLKAVFGSDMGHAAKGVVINVVKSVAHPKFSMPDYNTTGFDIAYVTLAKDIPSFSRIMKVNNNNQVPIKHSVVRAAGYGLHYDMNDVSEYPNSKLHQVDVPVTGQWYCRTRWLQSYYEIAIDKQNTICAGYHTGGCGICHGDSGGPIIQYNQYNVPVLVGVTAITYGCEMEYVPSGYARVSFHTKNGFLPVNSLSLTGSTKPVMLTQKQSWNPFSPMMKGKARPQPGSGR